MPGNLCPVEHTLGKNPGVKQHCVTQQRHSWHPVPEWWLCALTPPGQMSSPHFPTAPKVVENVWLVMGTSLLPGGDPTLLPLKE
jgi:hypothetical protein